ncbi:hypothetical protein PC116_g21844 [Phytophthora cactorum]|uniref:Uncharacterized protein n=1 Tax=Phytophthora cactorum TaxID=29920 RepID=A0A8T1JXQ7_9STRA|nr:hypothetical protein PC114_g19402 [Phytophthora cactorum]KAG2912537.1 hypothetical protein PC117_g18867 [Phytophthora cactorum]KAG2991863.1 hypothetical protein PC119_g18778 [Phytophthora cactorum]KAG3131099.1 hypothetical protein PC128_g26651 [Phytophthora cactorum]KAG4229844.1 hypothetical protein PC116_g21844 [Phytophthora cactorum]
MCNDDLLTSSTLLRQRVFCRLNRLQITVLRAVYCARTDGKISSSADVPELACATEPDTATFSMVQVTYTDILVSPSGSPIDCDTLSLISPNAAAKFSNPGQSSCPVTVHSEHQNGDDAMLIRVSLSSLSQRSSLCCYCHTGFSSGRLMSVDL